MAVRLSMAGYKQEDSLLNLPLWATETLQHIDPKTEDRIINIIRLCARLQIKQNVMIKSRDAFKPPGILL